MKKLLTYILEGIVDGDKFTIEESDEDSTINFKVVADPAVIGMIIGKGGRTIKAIQNILRVKARLEKASVFVEVVESTT